MSFPLWFLSSYYEQLSDGAIRQPCSRLNLSVASKWGQLCYESLAGKKWAFQAAHYRIQVPSRERRPRASIALVFCVSWDLRHHSFHWGISTTAVSQTYRELATRKFSKPYREEQAHGWKSEDVNLSPKSTTGYLWGAPCFTRSSTCKVVV